MIGAVSQGLELLILFVVLPFLVAGGVIAFVAWRGDKAPPPVRTSDILATGEAGSAEVLSVKPMTGFPDGKPMVKLNLRIEMGGEAAFELEVVQSIPRGQLREVSVGDTVSVRVTPDRAHAALVL